MRLTKWQHQIITFIQMTVGSVVGAAAVVIFLAPSEVAPTGVVGLAVLLNHLVHTPIGLIVFIFNIPIMILGYRMLPGGWRFVVSTGYVVVVYSLALDLLEPVVIAAVSEDRLLNALFGGVLGGISGGLVYRTGGTMGGTSVLARILQRRSGTPMSTTFLYTDTIVIVLAGLVYGWEGALYAIVALFIGGVATDYVMEGPSVIRTAVIITDKPEEVAGAIMSQLARGVTSLQAKGMYTGQERSMLYVTVARSQVPELRRITLEHDPRAFIVIGQGHVAYGEGFRRAN